MVITKPNRLQKITGAKLNKSYIDIEGNLSLGENPFKKGFSPKTPFLKLLMTGRN